MERGKGWKLRWSKLVRKIERIHTLGDRQGLLERLCHPDKPVILAFANAHAMNLLAKSEYFFESLCATDIVLRDGSGMETLFNQLNIPPGLNLNGTDLIPDAVSQFNGHCIAFLGTQEPYLESGVEFVQKNLAPQSSCVRADGFLDDNAYISLAAECRPALIVLGMGMPRQEEVAIALRSRLTFPCLIICGGAIIDFWGGKTSRAPLWMRQSGMEWLFRLQMEPRRLFQRYVIGNLVFLARAMVFPAFDRRLGRPVIKRQVKNSTSAFK
ncbi:WecB/TagA/CpsF family glycosyltransferase [Polaromonas glacialis]|uniref:WecB/TagA/CpsF family glycosyltransferase n=1 Tax=Polaromonas glacialis TaxID=866564 RepID=UPI0005605070|nr:WecB/TagA/CpsF family glycosyltransferase [Polaromonas glacialis]